VAEPWQYADLSFIPHGTALLIIKDARQCPLRRELLTTDDHWASGCQGTVTQPRRASGRSTDSRRGVRRTDPGRLRTPPSPRLGSPGHAATPKNQLSITSPSNRCVVVHVLPVLPSGNRCAASIPGSLHRPESAGAASCAGRRLTACSCTPEAPGPRQRREHGGVQAVTARIVKSTLDDVP
jgi:hypothetical protein